MSETAVDLLLTARGEGDRDLLKAFLDAERYIRPRDPACWLAARDLYETLWATQPRPQPRAD